MAEAKGPGETGRWAWVDRREAPEKPAGLANISSGDFPPQWPGPCLALLGLPRAVALNGLRYGRRQPCSSLQLRS